MGGNIIPAFVDRGEAQVYDFNNNIVMPTALALYRQWFRVRMQGLHNVPRSGPALIVANHSGVLPLDAVMLQAGVYDEFLAALTAAAGGTKVALLTDATNGGKYDPASITIKTGDSVTWDWQDDSASHTVTDDNGAFDSSSQSKGFTFSYKFDKAGTFGYSCTIHPAMKGSVTVQ